MSKKSLGPTILIVLGLVFIATIGLRTISTPEIWSHLAQGRDNVPLSFLASDSAVNTTWLYDKLAYVMWNAGGPSLLIILNMAGLVAMFVLLMQVSKKWGGAMSQGFALLIAGHLIFQSIDVGPEIIMMLMIALTLYLLSTLKQPAVLFATLIPLEILWTNMHGSFIYGPILAGLTAVQAAQQNKAPTGRTRKKQGIPSGTYAILAVAMLAATAANPYLFKMHGQVIANIKMSAPAYWSSLFLDYFQIPAIKPLILFVMVLGAGGLITLKKKLPVVLTSIAIYGAFMVWASPQKMAFQFAVLAFPFIVLSLTSISEYIHGSLEQVLGKQAKLLAPATSSVLVLLFILSIIPMASNCAYVKNGSASNFGVGAEEQLYPSGAEAVIGDPAFPAPERTINLAADGGYLAFKYPGRKIFIDYRAGRYDEKVLTDLNSMLLGDRAAYDRMYETYRPEAFIINTLHPSSASGIITLLSKGFWKLAYFDGTTAILVLKKEGLSSILDNTQAQQAGLEKLEKARKDYVAKAGSCKAGNPAELIGSGKVFLALNRAKESQAIFSLLLQNNSQIPGAWIGLGESQLRLKDYEAAATSLKTATELAPKNLLAWRSYVGACYYCSQRLKDPDKQAYYKAEMEKAIEEVKKLMDRQKKNEKEEPASDDLLPEEPTDQNLQDLTLPEGK